MKAQGIYHKMRAIAEDYHAYTDQLTAIAMWIEAEFEYKPQKLANGVNTSERQLTIPVVMGSTHLVVIRDWISPYNSNMKGNHAPAEYWAKKLGKDTNTFVKDFENGCLDQWFKVYCP